jgi:7TM-HD extracellular
MVRRLASTVFAASLAFSLSAQPAPKLTAYQIGDRATQDVVAPMPLVVVDHAATEALRDQAAQQIPVFFRFYPAKADEAVSEFTTAINNTRYAFLQARLADKTAGAEANGPLSGPAVAAFRAQNNAFPADDKWLTLWAANQGDDQQAALAAKLRDTMSRHIHADSLPAALKLNGRARLLNITDPTEPVKLDAAELRAVEISTRTDLVALERARNDLTGSFPAQELAIAKFVAGFVRENAEPDMALTRASRDRQTAALLSADSYDAGEIIVKRGQIITAKTKTALDQLNDKLQAQARETQLQQQAALSQTRAMVAGERSRWLFGSLLVVVVIGGAAIWWQIRRARAAGSLLPARLLGAEDDGVVISCPTCAEHIVVPMGMESGSELPSCDHANHEEWRRRAIAAEQRAQQATAIVRAGMLSHLARYLSTELVKKLIAQRSDLIDGQQQAAERVEALAGRLENLEMPVRESEQFYQQRIAELEKQLAESNELNRSLIKSKIAAARRQLDEAKTKASLN